MTILTPGSVAPFLPQWISLYQQLHRNPELSGMESATSQRLAEELSRMGFSVMTGIGGYGLAGVLKNGPGPVVLLRADMDALPIEEQTALPFASRACSPSSDGRSTPVMHACGHDVHMSVLIGTAQLLCAMKSAWSGTLVAIGQPAEEKMNGAKAMLDDGLYRKIPRPDFALSLHVAPDLHSDTVGVCPGYAWACADMLTLTIRGISGHGAAPHKTRDPLVLSAQIILALQTIVSREIDPVDSAVISVGAIHGGSAFNIIPDQVSILMTLRSYTPEVRRQLFDAIRRQLKGLAMAAGLPEELSPTFTMNNAYTPPVYNDPDLTARMEASFRTILGAEKVLTIKPEMVGEDFGLFGLVEPRIPLSIFRLGTLPPGSSSAMALHSCHFAPDVERAIPTGVLALSSACLDLLRPQ